MVKVMFIPDIECFLRFVDCCNGSVLLEMPEVGSCDLKTNSTARQMLRLTGRDGLSCGLELSFTDQRDISLVMQFLMESARTSHKQDMNPCFSITNKVRRKRTFNPRRKCDQLAVNQ